LILLAKMEIEMVVPDNISAELFTRSFSLHGPRNGDGRVFVARVSQSNKIRSGEPEAA